MMRLWIFVFLFSVSVSIDFDIVEATIPEIKDAFQSGQLDCENLIRFHIERIVEYNLKVKAVITINPDAILTAKKFDNEEKFGSLWCIPTLIKDNIDVAGLPTTGGSLSLSNSYPFSDAPVVRALKSAGVIIVGKAAMSEFAADGMNTNTSIRGQTLNLYCHDRTPFGSSGGVGAGITSSFAVIGIGTDTCGSVVNPSSAASLVGMRPDRNHTNNKGIIPLNFDQDVYGIMMRRASDVLLVWNEIKKVQPTPPVPSPMKGRTKVDGIKRIGYLSDYLIKSQFTGDPDPDIIKLVNSHISDLQKAGTYEVIELPDYNKFSQQILPYFQSAGICSTDLMKFYLNEYLNNTNSFVVGYLGNLRTLVDGETFGKSLVSFFQSVLENGKNPFEDPECIKYQTLRSLMRSLNMGVMKENQLDVLIYPSSNQKAPLLKDLQKFRATTTMDDVVRGIIMPPTMNDDDNNNNGLEGFTTTCLNSAWSGLPSIDYPIGYTADSSNSPFGMNAIGVDEETLIQFASEMEEKFAYRKPPVMP